MLSRGEKSKMSQESMTAFLQNTGVQQLLWTQQKILPFLFKLRKESVSLQTKSKDLDPNE